MYRDTVAPLYGYLLRQARGVRSLAEDATQETYLRALDRWRGARWPDEPLAWLQTVGRNLIRSHFRRARPQTVDDVDLDLLLAEPAPDSADAVRLLQWGLSRLREREVQLLEAFHLERRTVRDIATQLGLSERSVEGRLRRARAKLERRLAPFLDTKGESP